MCELPIVSFVDWGSGARFSNFWIVGLDGIRTLELCGVLDCLALGLAGLVRFGIIRLSSL